jgi:pyridoxal phosphate enzyme (YggS family)
MPQGLHQIAENVACVRRRMAEAATRSGRKADKVTLVAVTKYVDDPLVRAVVEAGCDVLGESRPQALWEKAPRLADLAVRWHMIGHLQRNKVRRTLPLVAMIHSADSVELIADIDRIAGEQSQQAQVLLEVNISGEEAKHGFAPAAIERLLPQLAGYRHVRVGGLMCMAGLEGGPDGARRDFATLRTLRDRLRHGCPEGVFFEDLSMGMSGDYEAAIEEGATIVRVGSALFEGVLP